MNNPFKTSRLEIRVREKYNSNIFVFYCNFTFNLVVSTVVMVKKLCWFSKKTAQKKMGRYSPL